jgi:hypothetical protein
VRGMNSGGRAREGMGGDEQQVSHPQRLRKRTAAAGIVAGADQLRKR